MGYSLLRIGTWDSHRRAWYTCPVAVGKERCKVNKLNVVIAELQLVVALLAEQNANTSKDPEVVRLLSKAKLDLAEATQQITGQNPIGGSDT